MSQNADAQSPDPQSAAEAAPAGLEGGSYEIIRKRLVDHGAELARKADALNEQRKATFGSSQMELLGTVRVRTANRCVPRDIKTIGDHLLFGYNVFTGMAQTEVGHVLNAHRLKGQAGEFEVEDLRVPYLEDPNFVKIFTDLYQYNRGAKLLQLRVIDGKLLAVFQIGSTVRDIRVLRWKLEGDGQAVFMDDRGDRDHVFPPSHDFEWKMTSREQHVYGNHPHISINNKVFVECIGGDLTIKVENNTASGEGIYSEKVDDPYQDLAAADIYYAELGPLVLFRIRPNREEKWRHLIYNSLTQTVARADAIAHACVQLPEEHGLIFPGGYYLTTGELKIFTEDVAGLEFKRVIKSPNGEDVLYAFHRRVDGHYILLPYNLIRKEIQNAILCHGYSLFDDGRMVVFRYDSDEATQVHPMQIWQTPFVSDVFAANAPTDGSFLSKLGNAELVRGLAEVYTIARAVREQRPTVQIYEELIAQTRRAIDTYHWIGRPEVGDLLGTLKQVLSTADLIVDEFEKVLALRKQAQAAMAEVEKDQAALLSELSPDYWTKVDDFIKALDRLRHQRGRLITLREVRYINLARLGELEAQAIEGFERVSKGAVAFLLKDDALRPYHQEVEALTKQIDAVVKVTEADALQKRLDEMSGGMDLLTEVIGNLKIDDATARTQILEGISEVFALLNRTRALLVNHRKSLRSKEAVAEFAAQFKLLGQSVSNALALVDTPEKCDDQLSRLMVQLEEMEGRFAEFDEFLVELTTKRDEIYEAFEARKQGLLEARQKRASNLAQAADRIIQGVQRRAQSFKEAEALNTYFASDAMLLKARELSQQLRELGDSVRADDVDARLKAARDQALRALRDKQEIFEDGAAVIRLGRHRFSVNTQALELTMLPREDQMVLHLTGTDFFEVIDDPALLEMRGLWQQALVSETEEVYRGEYLAACVLFDAEEGRKGLSIHKLHEATRSEGGLLLLVREYAADRYDEGYERGIHDHDTAKILEKLLNLRTTGGLLRYAPWARAAACLFWGLGASEGARRSWHLRARSLGRLRESLGHGQGLLALSGELAASVGAFCEGHGLGLAAELREAAGSYLAEELVADRPRFVSSAEAERLKAALLAHLDKVGQRRAFEEDLKALEGELSARFGLAMAWLEGLLARGGEGVAGLELAASEAAVLLLLERSLDREVSSALTSGEVTELLGQHPRIKERTLSLRLDEFLPRLRRFVAARVPAFGAWRRLRQETLERERERLRLEEYKPRVLTSFVRNQLINQVYLPVIGDNLAKQMGTVGENKRTDLMGMLLLISPPGYGKTTLMEYVANRLGLVFMKINGPALGHSVTSLDPSEAPNATARQELLKLNLGLEMGNNVMLYVDDIQHTNPEFLQKFISLCDGQRRIEGVWKGRTRTYDMRGKKFCVVMAGNPYTESGDKFQIPDMLANRADTYNLGDILGGQQELFALSYIENTLTSNPVLAPLATREQSDLLKLVQMARGEAVPANELKHEYSSVELSELQAVLRHLFRCQAVLLRVNQEYILSAGQEDAYRTEPPFKLQGSYRNMNKLAEKVVPVMNEAELEALIDDHYQGEAQTLTTGAEQNLLKLAAMRGRQTPEQAARWEEIRKGYRRIQAAGGKEEDPVTRITNQLGGLNLQLEAIHTALEGNTLGSELSSLREALSQGEVSSRLAGVQAALERQDMRQPLQGIAQALSTQAGLSESLASIARSIGEAAQVAAKGSNTEAQITMLGAHLRRIGEQLAALGEAKMSVQIVNEPPVALHEVIKQQVELVEWTLVPLVRSMAQDLQGGRDIWERLGEVLAQLKGVPAASLGAPSQPREVSVFAQPIQVPSGEYAARTSSSRQAQAAHPGTGAGTVERPRQGPVAAPSPSAAVTQEVTPPGARAQEVERPRVNPQARVKAAQPRGGQGAPKVAVPEVEVNLPEVQIGSQSVDEDFSLGSTLKLPAVQGPEE